MTEAPIDRLEKERLARKMNKRRFAIDVLGIDAQTYNNWLNRGFPITDLDRVAGKLNWSLDYLWRGMRKGVPDEDLEQKLTQARQPTEGYAELTPSHQRSVRSVIRTLLNEQQKKPPTEKPPIKPAKSAKN